MNTIGNVLIIIGGLFMALSGLGILRMPDVYNRLQAGTKASTLGAICTVVGVMFLRPGWWLELLVVLILLLLGAPVASSVLARAVHSETDYKAVLVKDDLKEKE